MNELTGKNGQVFILKLKLPELVAWLCCLFLMWTWTSFLSSLHLSSLTWHGFVMRIRWDDPHKVVRYTWYTKCKCKCISYFSCLAPDSMSATWSSGHILSVLWLWGLHAITDSYPLYGRAAPSHMVRCERTGNALLHYGAGAGSIERRPEQPTCQSSNEHRWAKTFHDSSFCFLFPCFFLFSKTLVQTRPLYKKEISRPSDKWSVS